MGITGKTKLTMNLTGTSTTAASTAFRNMSPIQIIPNALKTISLSIRKLNLFSTTLIVTIIILREMME